VDATKEKETNSGNRTLIQIVTSYSI